MSDITELNIHICTNMLFNLVSADIYTFNFGYAQIGTYPNLYNIEQVDTNVVCDIIHAS